LLRALNQPRLDERLVNAICGVLEATIPGGFKIATKAVPLSEVERAWAEDQSGRRLVFTMHQDDLEK
jgi:hypothetical protein